MFHDCGPWKIRFLQDVRAAERSKGRPENARFLDLPLLFKDAGHAAAVLNAFPENMYSMDSRKKEKWQLHLPCP